MAFLPTQMLNQESSSLRYWLERTIVLLYRTYQMPKKSVGALKSASLASVVRMRIWYYSTQGCHYFSLRDVRGYTLCEMHSSNEGDNRDGLVFYDPRFGRCRLIPRNWLSFLSPSRIWQTYSRPHLCEMLLALGFVDGATICAGKGLAHSSPRTQTTGE